MKKTLIFTLGLFLAIASLTSCGGDDSDAKEKARLDSLRQDSIEKAVAEQARIDSLLQDSLAKVNDSLQNALNNQPIGTPTRSSGSDKDGGIVIKKIDNPKINTMTADPVKPDNDGGKMDVKGTSDGGGKMDVKGTGDGKKGGKLDIKKGK